MPTRRSRSSQAPDLTTLRAAVAQAKTPSPPDETPLLRLSQAERASHLGLVVDPEELRATEAAIASIERAHRLRAVAVPAAVDWRNHGGNFVTPIRDQQSCGSCVSFGTLAS